MSDKSTINGEPTELDYAMRFIAGFLVLGLPIAYFTSMPFPIGLGVCVAFGVAAMFFGDKLFIKIADSNWWQVLRSCF